MENARRLVGLWAWLPAFRAAAETEHLPSAAAKLHVTPSAVSRSVRLLERELGQKLFDRTGRRLVLNRDGRNFLTEVRTAMRIVDDGVQAIGRQELRGTVRLNLSPDFTEWLAGPAVLALRAAHPDLDLQILNVAPPQVPQALHQGHLDVAVTDQTIDAQRDDTDITQEHLTELDFAVYAAAKHALGKQTRIRTQLLEQYCFVAAPGDGYPQLGQQRFMKASDLRSAASLAAATDLLVCLPTALGAAYVRRKQLTRLHCSIKTTRQLFVAYRRPVATHPRTEALLHCLRRAHP